MSISAIPDQDPELLNRLLIGWIRAEARWLRRGDLPFGTSVIALARKEGA